ncbi:MAG: helix-turn-helix transcriptional regulator [Cyclobacteriaceae bacterium]
MTTEVKPEFLTVNQCASMLQLSRPSIYQLFKDRKLTPIKFGSSTRVRLSEIQNLR